MSASLVAEARAVCTGIALLVIARDMGEPRAMFRTIAVALLVLAVPLNRASAASKYRNCASLNIDYPNGVGRPGAADQVKGGSTPVTSFVIDGALYKSLPKTLDRDRDGIACEKI